MNESDLVPGHRNHGSGKTKIIALHDWISDGSAYEPMLPYLDPELYQWAFMDLRGYGLSRHLSGIYSLEEAASDVVALADKLNWNDFHLVGHSMSGMIIQKVAAKVPQRILSLVAIAPVSAHGQPLDNNQREGLQEMARERKRANILRSMWGERLSESWFQFKLRRWRETAEAEASIGYVEMFAGPGFADEIAGFNRPVLLIAGSHDSGPFTEDALLTAFAPLYPKLTTTTIRDAGHYPMQETPVLLATIIGRFLSGTISPHI